MDRSPFDANPLTRNRILPSVKFVSPSEAKDLKVPEARSSWKKMQEFYDSLHVPQNESPISRIGAFGARIAKDGTKIIQAQSPMEDWGDAWGGDDFNDFRREQQLNKRSAEFAKRSQIGNAKLSAELEKDAFRKQLLADVENGKIFRSTRLQEVDESKNATINERRKENG